MDAHLRAEQPIGVVPGDHDGHALDPGFVAWLQVEHLGGKFLGLTPAQIHAHKDAHPILSLGAAGACVDGDHGVAGIVLAGEHALKLHGLDPLNERIQGLANLREGFLVAFGHAHFEQEFRLFQLCLGGVPAFHNILDGALFPLHLLGVFLVIPESRGQGELFQFLQSFSLVIYLKDAPSGR